MACQPVVLDVRMCLLTDTPDLNGTSLSGPEEVQQKPTKDANKTSVRMYLRIFWMVYFFQKKMSWQ